MPGSDEDVTRLIAVIERQRRELDRIRAAAADQSVIAMARGALMERLGLSSAEAAGQLANLSAATGMSLGEMAAAVLARDEIAEPGLAVNGKGSRGAGAGRGVSEPSSLRAEATAELAADGAELAGALAAQVLAPAGRGGGRALAAGSGRHPGPARRDRPVQRGGEPLAARSAAAGLPRAAGRPRRP